LLALSIYTRIRDQGLILLERGRVPLIAHRLQVVGLVPTNR
jgi:hypothetical protein